MEEQLITFETAKLAKEKGFNIPIINFYDPKGYCTDALGYQTERLEESDWNNGMGSYPTPSEEVSCSAPTQSLLQKWLREIHNIHIIIHYDYSIIGGYIVTNIIKSIEPIIINQVNKKSKYENYRTYEDVLEIGLQKALKLIK